MTGNYRHGAGTNVLEIPRGFINENEVASDVARRELLEETGYMHNGKETSSEYKCPYVWSELVEYYYYLGHNCFASFPLDKVLTRCSADLNANAEIVNDGLTTSELGIMEPSTTYNPSYFLAPEFPSNTFPKLSTTPQDASFPIGHPPSG
jgi:hypothetical protein